MSTLTIDQEGLRWFENSPSAGDPACLCSHCGQVIGNEEIPIRLWREVDENVLEARLHHACFQIRVSDQGRRTA